jgi:2'-5' RNA ligase
MTATDSPNGRRVLVAVVTGALGEMIQDWRERYDPQQARRLPPHATLCYWAPEVTNEEKLEAQVRHAFDRPVAVTLGQIGEFSNRDGTFFIEVLNTGALNAARARLYDGNHLQLEGEREFTWHVTCVRYPDNGQREELRLAAAELSAQIAASPIWTVDTIAWLELRGDRYEAIREWAIE